MAQIMGQSKKITTSGVISTASKSANIWAITLLSGTIAGSITIKNGGSNGTEMWTLTTIATTAAGDAVNSIVFTKPLICSTDAYGTISGTGAIAWIHFDETQP